MKDNKNNADNRPTWYLNKLVREKEYQKQNYKALRFVLNKNTDAEIIKHLETIGNKNGYIKQLIRADMDAKKGD